MVKIGLILMEPSEVDSFRNIFCKTTNLPDFNNNNMCHSMAITSYHFTTCSGIMMWHQHKIQFDVGYL